MSDTDNDTGWVGSVLLWLPGRTFWVEVLQGTAKVPGISHSRLPTLQSSEVSFSAQAKGCHAGGGHRVHLLDFLV